MKAKHLQPKTGAMLPTLLLAASGLLCAGGAKAQIVSFNFSGTIDSILNDTGGVRPSELSIGAPFTGTMTYDASLPINDNNINPNVGFYIFSGPFANGFSFSLTVGGHTYTDQANPSFGANSISFANGSPDNINFNLPDTLRDGASWPGSPNFPEITLQFTDISGSALGSDALATTAPTLSQFPDVHRIAFTASSASGGLEVRGTIADITPVPEPAATGAVIATGLAGFALWRRSRKTKAPVD